MLAVTGSFQPTCHNLAHNYVFGQNITNITEVQLRVANLDIISWLCSDESFPAPQCSWTVYGKEENYQMPLSQKLGHE